MCESEIDRVCVCVRERVRERERREGGSKRLVLSSSFQICANHFSSSTSIPLRNIITFLNTIPNNLKKLFLTVVSDTFFIFRILYSLYVTFCMIKICRAGSYPIIFCQIYFFYFLCCCL